MEKVKYERIPLDRFTRSDESNLGTLRFATGSKESSEVPGKKNKTKAVGFCCFDGASPTFEIFIYIYMSYMMYLLVHISLLSSIRKDISLQGWGLAVLLNMEYEINDAYL